MEKVMKKPFPPHRWGGRYPSVEGWYWFVGRVGGQWKCRIDEPALVRFDPDGRVPPLGGCWHEHEYGQLRKSPVMEMEGRWYGPVRCPAGWER